MNQSLGTLGLMVGSRNSGLLTLILEGDNTSNTLESPQSFLALQVHLPHPLAILMEWGWDGAWESGCRLSPSNSNVEPWLRISELAHT
jgi:hypothetical protein